MVGVESHYAVLDCGVGVCAVCAYYVEVEVDKDARYCVDSINAYRLDLASC